MSDVMEAEAMPVDEVVFAKPTQNYRKTMRPDGTVAYYRCWIVDDTLDWREVPVVDGEIVG